MAKQKIDLGAEAADNTVALNPIVGLAREDLMGAVALMLRETAGRPVTAVKHMRTFSGEVAKILQGKSEIAPDPKDRRFSDPAFKYNPFYRGAMQYYLAVQKGVKEWMVDLELDELERARASFVTTMILDSLAPTNSLIGNPSALKRVIDTGGGSLLKGLKNAYEVLTQHDGIVSEVDT